MGLGSTNISDLEMVLGVFGLAYDGACMLPTCTDCIVVIMLLSEVFSLV